MKNNNNKIFIYILCLLLILGFLYRLKGLTSNYSFWTDEEHVAIFSRAILERGKPVLANGYSTGIFQFFQYWIGAVSAKIFGLNEFALRFPSVIFGVLTIWATYLLGKKLFSERTGLLAAFFITFLRIEILWSRQARPYQAVQFLILLGSYFFLKLIEKNKLDFKLLFLTILAGIIATLFHGLGIVFFAYLAIYLFFVKPKWLFNKWLLFGLIIVFPVLYLFRIHISAVIGYFGKINNFYFYRVFLWYNYSLFVFLGLIGILNGMVEKKKNWLFPATVITVQFFVASFFLNQPFTRYYYIVFPFLVILASVGLDTVINSLKTSSLVKNISIILLAVFVVSMGWKFTLAPKAYYPLNEDMQEIPQVDWKRVYGFVDVKIKNNPGTVLLSSWTDLPIWFLGEDSLNYLVRKQKDGDLLSNAKIIGDLDSFKTILKENDKGIFVLDSWDNYVPDGIREYADKNLKKEMENDRLYPIQPRYWPVNVYSWGLSNNEKPKNN